MTSKSLDGPRAGARTRPRHLVALLHGYGSDGNDLIALAKQWQRWLPDAAFVAPHAPDPCPGAPMGRQWFPLTMRDPDERWRGVNQAAPALNAFLDAELGTLELAPDKLALVGFSQGTMMALHVGLRRSRAAAAIVGFSGMLVGGEHLQPGDIPSPPPPVLLTHGSNDDIIPVEALFMSAETLGDQNVACQWHLSVGTAHGIDAGAMDQAGMFLAQSFGLKTPSVERR